MSASQRRKGAGGEREVVRLLRDELGVVVDRNLGQTRDGGADIHLGRFRIEVKRRKRLSHYQWLDQAQAACKPGDSSVVVARGDGREWFAMLPIDLLVRLLRAELE